MSPVGIVCGSSTQVGGVLLERLRAEGSELIVIDPLGAPPVAATAQFFIDITKEVAWAEVAQSLRSRGIAPTLLAYTLYDPGAPTELHHLDAALWDRHMDHHLRGVYLATRVLLPLMANPGAIVLLASAVAGWDSRADLVALGASSGGALALTQALALAAAPLGVRVNVVCVPPPPVVGASLPQMLKRIPLGRLTTPVDIVDALMFLLSDDALHVTGTSLLVDGGQSLQSWSNAPEG